MILKSLEEVEKMRQSGGILALILQEMAARIAPGMTTADINAYALQRCHDHHVIPAFQGYHGFPGCVCISINDEVVHGIPSSKRFLLEGDIVGLDFGVIKDGWYADAAMTVAVGKVSEAAKNLMDVTQKSLHLGIEAAQAGNYLGDIGFSVQNYVEQQGLSVVREFVGHGIGKNLHEKPEVPNYGKKQQGLQLKVGLVIAIEPMVNMGSKEVKVLDDGWTVVTVDHGLSAHFEHTVAITPEGPRILTLP